MDWELRGCVVDGGAPVRVWLEVQDDDIVLHDAIAAGATRDDGTFVLRFPQHSFEQQPWEREDAPDIRLFVWRQLPVDRRLEPPGPPDHQIRFGAAPFQDRCADLGQIELDGTSPTPLWSLRGLNTSRRPGRPRTDDELAAISASVQGWVRRACRVPSLPDVEVAFAPCGDNLGEYRTLERRILVDPERTALMSDSAVQRLLVHEWAHAVTHAVAPDSMDGGKHVRLPELLAVGVGIFAAETGLDPDDAARVLLHAAQRGNIEGYAHYVERLIVQEHLPFSALRVGRSLGEQLSEAVWYGTGLHDSMLGWVNGRERDAGLRYYQRAARGRDKPVRFRRSAWVDIARELLEVVGVSLP